LGFPSGFGFRVSGFRRGGFRVSAAAGRDLASHAAAGIIRGFPRVALACEDRADVKMAIRLKSRQEIEKMRAAGRVVRQVLDLCQEICKPGITTKEIDQRAYECFTKAGARGLFKNYPTYREGEGFPSHLCISVNQTVVHGIASDQIIIRDGDIVGIDCGVQLDGWCGDAATTIEVGNVPQRTRELCQVTRHVLDIAVQNIKPGRRWSQVARLMQNYAESHGMSVVRDFVGHGIGSQMHEEPKVPNFVSRELIKNDILLREGVVLAVEPMCNLGTHEVVTLADGWTVLTADHQPSAHYEHTIAVTKTGAEILTDGN
jgi:methionyl aminopeptidase